MQGDPIFSSQNNNTDYVTLRGVENRTGIEKENAYTFVIKELLDNAVDFLETQHIGLSRKHLMARHLIPAAAEVQVTILKENENNLLRIIVTNSNQYGKTVFSKSMLQSIFNFDIFYSSKRNQYKISRGALGDAFKLILGIPYALARGQQQQPVKWNEPLIITTRINGMEQTFLVYLRIDRINQRVHSQIVESEEKEKEREKGAQLQGPNFTQIEVRIPISEDLLDLAKLMNFVVDYATINTHIDFTFEVPANSGQKNTEHKYSKNIILRFPQTQAVNTNWTNLSSIYWCTLPEFQTLIFGLENNETTIYDVLQKTFREATNMKKTTLSAMTIGELKQSPNRIDPLYRQLRDIMKPSSNLSLPFDVNKRVRMEALRKRLEQREPAIKFSDMKYRSTYGYYNESNGIEYPFFFEIAVVRSRNIRYNLDFIHSLDSSVMPHGYTFMIGSGEETFRWQTESDKKKGSVRKSSNIFDIFEYYGYTNRKDKCKKPNSLIIANLLSPRIDYQSYGKSRIDLSPFASFIAEATVKACSGGSNNLDEFSNDKNIINFLRELLKGRRDKVIQDPALKETQKWTLSTVFYLLRRILLDKGFSIERINRQYITSEIKNVCENYLGVKREDLGITAADRAQLYFRGKWYDVGLEEISDLVKYGTDMVIIEKEGVVKQLAPFVDQKGIALLNTRGFLTEYASILSEQSENNGCNLAILTDFDASGLLMAAKLPKVYRIGIDFDTLAYFGLDPSIVEEDYKPLSNHLKPLQHLDSGDHNDDNDFLNQLGLDISKIFDDDVLEHLWNNTELSTKVRYVSSRRIEIDSIMAAVNDNTRFSEFIFSKLREKFPIRNYNRAINVPEYIVSTSLESLNQMMRKKSAAILEKERVKIKRQFSNTKGFLDVMQTDLSIAKQFRTIIENDPTMKPFLQKFDGLVKGDGSY